MDFFDRIFKMLLSCSLFTLTYQMSRNKLWHTMYHKNLCETRDSPITHFYLDQTLSLSFVCFPFYFSPEAFLVIFPTVFSSNPVTHHCFHYAWASMLPHFANFSHFNGKSCSVIIPAATSGPPCTQKIGFTDTIHQNWNKGVFGKLVKLGIFCWSTYMNGSTWRDPILYQVLEEPLLHQSWVFQFCRVGSLN